MLLYISMGIPSFLVSSCRKFLTWSGCTPQEDRVPKNTGAQSAACGCSYFSKSSHFVLVPHGGRMICAHARHARKSMKSRENCALGGTQMWLISLEKKIWKKCWFHQSMPCFCWGERGEIIASQRHFPDFYTKQALKVWRSPLYAFFPLKCQRKGSKKAKEHPRVRGVLGRWRTAAIDRTIFHGCQRSRKTAVFAVFPRLWGVIWRAKSLPWPAMPVSNKKQEFEQQKRIKLFDDFWVRANRFDFALRCRPRARSM